MSREVYQKKRTNEQKQPPKAELSDSPLEGDFEHLN